MTQELPANLFSRVLEQSRDAAVIIDEDGNIRYVNAALQLLSGYPPDAVLEQPIDNLLPEGLGVKRRAVLRRYVNTKNTSGVLSRAREFKLRDRNGDMVPVELKAIDLGLVGGVHYFGGFLRDMRARRAEEAKTAALVAQLEQQAMTDPLTALPNRRAFDTEAARLVARGRRNNAPAAMGIGDIDHFKQINDQYGHPAGDLVLCEVGKATERAARGSDFVARIGGEEFGMLFPDTTIEMALFVANRIRNEVAACEVTTPDGECIRVTLSIGLAALEKGAAMETALASADTALYQAKDQGRNRVKTAQPASDEAAAAKR
jgi:diguanylate cyclase (GGDEF)-like protein/PAS domain S-box-containing protein